MSEQQYRRAAKRLSAALRQRRKQLGWTQEEVAESLGIVTRQYQKIEAGQVNLTLRSLAKLAATLGVEPHDLLKG